MLPIPIFFNCKSLHQRTYAYGMEEFQDIDCENLVLMHVRIARPSI